MMNYFDMLNEKFDALSDEEFEMLLQHAGIENCPFEEPEYCEVFNMEVNKEKKKSIRLKASSNLNLTEYDGGKKIA